MELKKFKRCKRRFLFVAIKGFAVDGHKFIEDAIKKEQLQLL